MSEVTMTWTGLVPSTSGRKSKRTGRPMEYRVTLFSDGTGTCSCPGAIFYDARTPEPQPGDREHYACKHIALARQQQGQAARATPPIPARASADEPAKGSAEPASADEFLDEFGDDLLSDLPQVRHERRD